MAEQPVVRGLTVAPFEWKHWRALWELRLHQLAEHGIIIPSDMVSDRPLNVRRDDYEWDYHHLTEIYLQWRGGFWLAWYEDTPVGHIGGQDLGDFIELRRMYVRQEYRRRGIGACLVQALLDQCHAHSVKAIELWTAKDGPGRFLYEQMGFQVITAPGMNIEDLIQQSNYLPGENEIRMRLDLS